MTLTLRQICLVAPTLEPAVGALCDALATRVFYRDPNVAKYGLENALLPVGNTFLEVVAPTQDGTAAGRYLARRKGEGGYMIILETDDITPWIGHVASLGVRVAADLDYPGEYRGLQLHPRDTGGCLLEINCSHGADRGAYHPAGPDWAGGPALPAIVGATVQSDDPAALAARWSAILRCPVRNNAIALDHGTIRFVPATDGRGEGLAGIEISGMGKREMALCGIDIRLVA
jgi:Glyoxalase-like domain